jgi:hypothetical protein
MGPSVRLLRAKKSDFLEKSDFSNKAFLPVQIKADKIVGQKKFCQKSATCPSLLITTRIEARILIPMFKPIYPCLYSIPVFYPCLYSIPVFYPCLYSIPVFYPCLYSIPVFYPCLYSIPLYSILAYIQSL